MCSQTTLPVPFCHVLQTMSCVVVPINHLRAIVPSTGIPRTDAFGVQELHRQKERSHSTKFSPSSFWHSIADAIDCAKLPLLPELYRMIVEYIGSHSSHSLFARFFHDALPYAQKSDRHLSAVVRQLGNVFTVGKTIAMEDCIDWVLEPTVYSTPSADAVEAYRSRDAESAIDFCDLNKPAMTVLCNYIQMHEWARTVGHRVIDEKYQYCTLQCIVCRKIARSIYLFAMPELADVNHHCRKQTRRQRHRVRPRRTTVYRRVVPIPLTLPVTVTSTNTPTCTPSRFLLLAASVFALFR